MIQGFSGGLLNRQLIYNLDLPSFQRDFASLKTLDHGTGPAITFTRASNATFFDANGVLQTAANDVPRFDHSQDGAASSLGLLIEEARTNSIPNSQMSGVVAGSPGTPPTGWGINTTNGGLSRSSIATGTINGMAYIDVRVTGTATSTFGFGLDPQATIAGYAASSGQTWSGSCYFALVAGTAPTNFQISIAERDSSNFSLAGTTINLPALSATLSRHTVTRTLNNASTAKVTMDIRGSVANAEVVDFTLRIAAPQLEQGAFPTSYIATTTAAATRSADVASVSPVSSFYNAVEGTMFAEFVFAGNNDGTVMCFDKNPATDRSILTVNTSAIPAFAITASSNTQANIAIGSAVTAGQVNRLIGAMRVDDFQAARNGTLGTADTSGSMPVDIARLQLGRRQTVGIFNGHIRKIAYYPKRLTDALLEQLTT